MAVKTKVEQSGEIHALEVSKGRFTVYVVGTTPIILNRPSEKAIHELLLPKPRKTAADKASALKHDPLAEYRASPYVSGDDNAPTRLLVRSTAFKGALRSVALDMPGTQKSQIGRLTFVENDYVSLYGVPKMLMAIVRNADINKTPDVRTRAIVPQWACKLTIQFVRPLLREQVVANLLGAAGIMRGVGDWRPEKGSGDYGQFEICLPDDPRYLRAINGGGLKEQDAALKAPDFYDEETRSLMSWFDAEVARRGFKVAA